MGQDNTQNGSVIARFIVPDQAKSHDGGMSKSPRLDSFLAEHCPELSRARIQALILNDNVEIDGQTISKPSHRLKAGSTLVLIIPPAAPAEPQPEDIPLEILHEDDQIIVVDKPVGMVVHPAPGSPNGTLVNALLAHCGDSLSGIGGVKRPGIVHRLDKDTSGVMVVAKTDAAHQHLAAQFADHGRNGPMQRRYVAFIWGALPKPAITIDEPIGRASTHRDRQAVTAQGRHAVTHLKRLSQYPTEAPIVSKIRCQLETGRTHQIRVHCDHIGHPVLGDPLYGKHMASKINILAKHSEDAAEALNALQGQALHAAHLRIAHPSNDAVTDFETPLPKALQKLEKTLQSLS